MGHHQRALLPCSAGLRTCFFFCFVFDTKFGSAFGGFLTPTLRPTFPNSCNEYSGSGTKTLSTGWDLSQHGGHSLSSSLPSPQMFWNVGCGMSEQPHFKEARKLRPHFRGQGRSAGHLVRLCIRGEGEETNRFGNIFCLFTGASAAPNYFPRNLL